MFKNRAFQVKLVKTDDSAPETMSMPDIKINPEINLAPNFDISKEDVEEITGGLIKKTALAVIAVIGVAALAHTSSEIVIHHATK